MVDTERKAEQQHLDVLYARLDELRVRSERALDLVRRQPTAGTPAARSERDAFAALHAGRLAQLRAVEDRLCFGRLDLLGGERRYIGRIGLSDDEQPAAARRLAGAGRRAVLPGHRGAAGWASSGAGTSPPSGRTVIGIEDEVLDLDAYGPGSGTAPAVAGEGALLVALDAAPHRPDARHRRAPSRPSRTGSSARRWPACSSSRAGRAPARPRSRCTAPRTCSTPTASGSPAAACWSSGRTRVFLRYIEQVLPSLGETGVVLRTPGAALPRRRRGRRRGARRSPRSRATCGWREVVRRAVRDRQRVPRRAGRARRRRHAIVLLRPSDVARRARPRARRDRQAAQRRPGSGSSRTCSASSPRQLADGMRHRARPRGQPRRAARRAARVRPTCAASSTCAGCR